MTVIEFQNYIFDVAFHSPICELPIVRQIGSSSINMRVSLKVGGFIDIFYNRQTDRFAFALIDKDQRIYGADNTGSWHVHPFDDPDQHLPIEKPVTFSDFVSEIERHYHY